MSIVRHKDKKSGSIRVFESTSHYDPVSKKSRPTKKYLGIEDPITGKLIPSSGRKGRRKKEDSAEGQTDSQIKKPGRDYRPLYEEYRGKYEKSKLRADSLEKENKRLYAQLEKVRKMASDALKSRELTD